MLKLSNISVPDGKQKSLVAVAIILLALLLTSSLSLVAMAADPTTGKFASSIGVRMPLPTRDPNLPTPTPPANWESRPNLHVLLTDQNGQPIGGVHLTIYKADGTKVLGDKPDGSQGPVEATTTGGTDINAGAGWAKLDAASFLYGMYYLEMREGDGPLILPFDPNGPHYGTGAPLEPIDRVMSLLDLSEGNVAYVFHYQIRPLISGPTSIATPYPYPAGAKTPPPTPTPSADALAATRAVWFQANEKWIYFPGAFSSLGQVSTVTPAPLTRTAGATFTQSSNNTAKASSGTGNANQTANATGTIIANSGSTITSGGQPSSQAGSSSSNPNNSSGGGSGNAVNPSVVAGAGGADAGTPVATIASGHIRQVLGGLPPGAHEEKNADGSSRIVYDSSYTPPAPTYTSLPDPTSKYAQECMHCISTAQAPSATAEAATIRAALTAGNYTPDPKDAGRSGGAGLPSGTSKAGTTTSSSATQTAMAGGSNSALGTPVASNNGSNGTATAGAVSNTTTTGGAGAINNQNQGQGQDFPWGTIVAIAVGLLLLGGGWLIRNRRSA